MRGASSVAAESTQYPADSMSAAPVASNRPNIRRADGSPLPTHLLALHRALTRAPARLRPNVARLASKLVLERLPAMEARYEDGRRFRVPAGDAMYAQVFIYGAYEPDESAVVSGLLRPGDRAIDIGANFGWYSMLMAAAVGPGGSVVAVEPVPAMLVELRSNVALNLDLAIEVEPIALGAARGEVELHIFDGLLHGHTSMSTLGRDDYSVERAQMKTLDDLLEGAPSLPALIKLDVEGAEREVIAGAGSTLEAEDAPIWMIEVNLETSAAFGYHPAEMLTDLEARRHHTVYRVAADGLVAETDPESAPHGTTWICVPGARLDRARPLHASART